MEELNKLGYPLLNGEKCDINYLRRILPEDCGYTVNLREVKYNERVTFNQLTVEKKGFDMFYNAMLPVGDEFDEKFKEAVTSIIRAGYIYKANNINYKIHSSLIVKGEELSLYDKEGNKIPFYDYDNRELFNTLLEMRGGNNDTYNTMKPISVTRCELYSRKDEKILDPLRERADFIISAYGQQYKDFHIKIWFEKIN